MRRTKRFVDRQYLDFVRTQPCLVRDSHCRGGIDPHHVKSVKNGGDDIRTNVVPLCRAHHTGDHIGIHYLGLATFAEIHPAFLGWLKETGWEFCPLRKTWRFPAHE